jgi:hypothetical protein
MQRGVSRSKSRLWMIFQSLRPRFGRLASAAIPALENGAAADNRRSVLLVPQ